MPNSEPTADEADELAHMIPEAVGETREQWARRVAQELTTSAIQSSAYIGQSLMSTLDALLIMTREDLRAEGAAEALHAALYELEVTQSSHDEAECAAPVPGEVGRQDAIDEWISICEEPVEWMRKFAQRYAHEAPSDAYIREVEEEARAEGRRQVLDALRLFRDEADKPLAVDLGNMVRAWLNEQEGIGHD